MDVQGFYTVNQFIDVFAVPRTSFYRLVRTGAIRLVKVGRGSRVAKADAKAWADSLPTVGGRS